MFLGHNRRQTGAGASVARSHQPEGVQGVGIVGDTLGYTRGAAAESQVVGRTGANARRS